MSVLGYPESMNSTDLQIWNNAAFDNGESEDSLAIVKSSWSPLKPVLLSSSESLDSFSSKENQNPLFDNNCLTVKSPVPLKSIHQNGAVENSKMKSIKSSYRSGFMEKSVKSVLNSGSEEELRDEKKIDQEIEEIEKEISRLSSRLDTLRIEKAEKIVKTVERRGRVVPAKFMEPKQIGKNAEEKKKLEEALSMSAKSKVQRRGFSMGPSEIVAGARRGMSLGPAEIFACAKSRQSGKQEITPIQPIANRRKSCFWKLQDIAEEKVTRERRKTLSVSPKSRKPNAKIQASRQAATTVASRKTVKREDPIVNSIQPKKLFKDGEKSAATNKKPTRPGRVVASRYNQSTNHAFAMRKRSLPENDQDESKRCDKKRSLSVGKSRATQPEIKNLGTEGRVKKRWEIPSEIVVHRSSESESSPPTISVVPDLLPRIKTARYFTETPRDSGPAKRVADLVGRRSYFSIDEEVEEPSVCQALSFTEDEVEEK